MEKNALSVSDRHRTQEKNILFKFTSLLNITRFGLKNVFFFCIEKNGMRC